MVDNLRILLNTEIKQLCNNDKKFIRSLDCVNSLQSFSFQLNKDHEQDEVEAKCLCAGSSSSMYRLSLKLNMVVKKITLANCTCPYKQKAAKEKDLCKHIVALLLRYFCSDFLEPIVDDGKFVEVSSSRLDAFPYISSKSEILEVKQEKNYEKKKRKLPSWMEVQKIDVSSSNKEELTAVSERNQMLKRKKKKDRCSSVKRTIYLMTPKEFLDTAYEVIRESEEENFRTENVAADHLKESAVNKEEIKSLNDNYPCLTNNQECAGSSQKTSEDVSCFSLDEMLSTGKTSFESANFIRTKKQTPSLNMEQHFQRESCRLSNPWSNIEEKDDYSILDELM